MKKIYSKPAIVFDNFQMCSSIAACAIETGASQGTCGLEYTNSIAVFTDSYGLAESACNFDVPVTVDEAGAEWNGICYDVPIEGFNMFNS